QALPTADPAESHPAPHPAPPHATYPPASPAPSTASPPDAPAPSPAAPRQPGQEEHGYKDDPEQRGPARERDVARRGRHDGRRRAQGHAELLCERLGDQAYAVRQPRPVFLPGQIGSHRVAN